MLSRCLGGDGDYYYIGFWTENGLVVFRLKSIYLFVNSLLEEI